MLLGKQNCYVGRGDASQQHHLAVGLHYGLVNIVFVFFRVVFNLWSLFFSKASTMMGAYEGLLTDFAVLS
jgi:hypothetical protein